MLIRIFTENKNYQDVVNLVEKYFDGATIIKADGLWQGSIEHSLIIEIDSPIVDEIVNESRFGKLIFDIKRLNKQDKVLVQHVEYESKLM